MLDALPRHVRDVQQAVDAAEVDERTVVGEVLDRALDDCAFLQVLHERVALRGELLLDHRTPRYHDVIALLIELDDLELERFVLEVRRVPRRAHIDERTEQECADVLDFHREAALDAAGDDAGDDLGIVEGGLEARPRAGALGLLAGQACFARAVFHRIERHLDFIARLDLDLAAFVLELVDGDHGLGLEAHVDDDDVVSDVDDEPREDHAGADALVGETLFEELSETFCHTFTSREDQTSHMYWTHVLRAQADD